MSSTMAMTSTERLRPSRTFSLRNTLRGGAKLPVPRPKTAESRQFAGVDSRASQQFFDPPQPLPEFESTSEKGKSNRDSRPVFGSSSPRPSTGTQKDGVVVVASAKKVTGKSFSVGGLKAGVGRTFSLSRGSSQPARTGPDQPPVAISTPAKPTKVLDDSANRRARVTTNSPAKELPESSVANSPAAADGTSKFERPTCTQGSASTTSDSSASSLDERGSKDGDTSTAASSITSYSSTKSSEGRGGKQGIKSSTPTRAGDALKKPRRGLNVFTRSSNSNASISRTSSSGTMSSRGPSVGVSAASYKIKDDMWEPYKILESDYSKFYSKSSNAHKVQIIKQCLLPFLRKFKGKAPSSTVLPEELEKRTKTLHKWWMGLLTHLKCRTTQAVSGADKPIYLEAVSYIISRPEWRSPPSTFAPLAGKLSQLANSASSSSLSSTSSDYSIHKSVQHNIKMLFIRSLYDTLSYTVERLGFRTAPPSLVAFGGKVLAYAFFFCPAVADMLITLWGVKPAILRRIPPQFGIERGMNMQVVSDAILCEFPETLHHLGFSNVAATIRQFRTPAQPPLGVQVEWEGPWLGRWRGRDSDLLFVFFKQYHILLCEFLPFDPTPTARLCAPGYLLVLAQLLSLIDDTIHRQPTQNNEPIASTTFEDLLNANTALPVPAKSANNSARSMAENKLIVLLKDVLSDTMISETACGAFVHSFAAMLKAAVQSTQLHDQNACFQICDLMEELVPVFTVVRKQGKGEFVDWPFWLQVTKLMLQSESNTTELRIISLVYNIYDSLAEDEERKRSVVLEWLLSEPVWERLFCHWCPMARAYYMRLTCWRIARFNGEASDVDIEIYKTLLLRLRTGFSHHMKMKEIGRPSSTAPCLPAPSRRLVILRNDTITTPSGLSLGGMIPTSFAAPQNLSRTNSNTSLASLAEVEPQLDSSASSISSTTSNTSSASTVSKGWSVIRSAFSFKPNTAEYPEPIKSSPPASKPGSASSDSPTYERQLVKVANFKFSLEYLERPVVGRERPIGPPRLALSTAKAIGEVEKEAPEIITTPESLAGRHWTYVGRALAEWAMVVVEYENFFERRKMEGRETPGDVETPTLAVDSLRKL